MNYKLNSMPIQIATEPYLNRRTNDLLITELNDVDDELMGWIKEAAAFSAAK
ncbi:hypothetical protein [Hespellia stercorisuis]|uniref:hypothetical protein n=1 Tax=Hespellia stercorisuis TaxID=180311 RepID=UPI0013565C29|nr:hypothetical protein [Hespellia stercorisuis]